MVIIVVVSAVVFGVIAEFRGDKNRKTRSKAKEFQDSGGVYNYLVGDEEDEDFFFDSFCGEEDEELLW
jgi:hypothetical protein